MSGEEAAILYQREVLRTGALVLGAELPSSWRPVDPHLCTVVDALDVLVDLNGTHPVDVGDLADLLRADDASVEWGALLRYLMERWDEVQDFVSDWGTAVVLAREVVRRASLLRRRVDRLEHARAAAERELEALNAACDAFELEVTW